MSETKKVFLVTAGEYSDYRIEAAFSTQELAEAYQADSNKVDGYEKAHIEVWDLDHQSETVVKEYWVARIQFSDGGIQAWNDGPYYSWARPNQRTKDWPNFEVYPERRKNSEELYIPEVFQITSFVSQEHANKVAIEKRQQIMARKAIGIAGIPQAEIAPNYGDTVD